jgi:hypothetical protein
LLLWIMLSTNHWIYTLTLSLSHLFAPHLDVVAVLVSTYNQRFFNNTDNLISHRPVRPKLSTVLHALSGAVHWSMDKPHQDCRWLQGTVLPVALIMLVHKACPP